MDGCITPKIFDRTNNRDGDAFLELTRFGRAQITRHPRKEVTEEQVASWGHRTCQVVFGSPHGGDGGRGLLSPCEFERCDGVRVFCAKKAAATL